MKKYISIEEINSIRPSFTEKFKNIINESSNKDISSIFYGEPGKSHYLLLAFIASQFKNQNIIVTDAWQGLSSLALTFEPTNTIHSFTQHFFMENEVRKQSNHLVHENINLLQEFQFENNRELILTSAVIFVDHSPHRGEDEYLLYNFLLQNNYKGIVISDHVWIHKRMRDEYLYKIPDKYRYDITEFGNKDGMIIYTFDTENQPFALIKPDVSNWTLVTAYFNLTKCPDANSKILERNSNYYMSHSISTLSLPYNMVIYCDEESLPLIQAIRPTEYDSCTVYRLRDFNDLAFTSCPCVDAVNELHGLTFDDYRDKINQNRLEHPYEFDERNTASYYLLCVSKYLMMIETLDENPFQSTHFAWINLCIERIEYTNLMHLSGCLTTNRDKFSACYTDYIPLCYIENTAQYYEEGLSSMCSGFFTGNAHYMRTTCKYIIEKFLYYLDLGYGNTDEQLFSPVYFDHPDLFDHYYGNCGEIITNYKYVCQKPTEIINNFVYKSFECGDYSQSLDACRFVLKSIALKKCKLDEKHTAMLRYYFTESSMPSLLTLYREK